MAHFHVIHLGLFLILACSTCSVTGLPVDYQLDELKENYIKLTQALADKDSHFESLQPKNELLRDLFIKMAVEALQQTAAGPILHFPDRAIKHALHDERSTIPRPSIVPESLIFWEEGSRTTTTPVHIRSSDNNVELNYFPSGEEINQSSEAVTAAVRGQRRSQSGTESARHPAPSTATVSVLPVLNSTLQVVAPKVVEELEVFESPELLSIEYYDYYLPPEDNPITKKVVPVEELTTEFNKEVKVVAEKK